MTAIERHCSCGASMTSWDRTEDGLAVIARFDVDHAGDGHQPVSPVEAAQARGEAWRSEP